MAKLKMPKVARSNRKENPEAVMSIGDHLRELRDRLIISAVAVLIGAVVGWFFFDQLFTLVTFPIEKANANGANLSANFGTILSSFDLRMRISLWSGVLLTSPVWMYEFWAYVGPGMTKKEKIYAWAFGVAGVLLFSSGCALGIWIMPHAVEILTGFIPRLTTTSGVIDVSVYLSFYLRIVLVFGVAFLLPELLVALNRLGLMKGKTMLKGWRWAVVLIFTFMAFANPLPDPWSMIFMALPITALYFIACGMSIMHDNRMAKKRAKEDAELEAALAAQEAREKAAQEAPVAAALPASEVSAEATLPASTESVPALEAAPAEDAETPALPATDPAAELAAAALPAAETEAAPSEPVPTEPEAPEASDAVGDAAQADEAAQAEAGTDSAPADAGEAGASTDDADEDAR